MAETKYESRPNNVKSILSIFKDIDKLGIKIRLQQITSVVKVNERVIRRWESEHLLFPEYDKIGRYYQYQDILRILTIKYLFHHYNMKSSSSIRLFLELAQIAVYKKPVEEGKAINLNNVQIDYFLMKYLNYDLDYIANMEK